MDDIGSIQRWLIGMAGLVILITGNAVFKARRRKRTQEAMLAWAQQRRFEIRFVEPPLGAEQKADSRLSEVIDLQIPFLSKAAYNHSSFSRDAIWNPADLTVFLSTSHRNIGKGSGSEELRFILKLPRPTVEGELSCTAEERTSSNLPWHSLGSVLNSRRFRSTEADRFRAILTEDVLQIVQDNQCLGFQVQGGYISIFFDGQWNPMTWDTYLPRARQIVDILLS